MGLNTMRWITAGSLSILLASCAQTTIYPMGGDTFSSVSTSSDQGFAEQGAKNKAEAYCQKMGKHLVVKNHETFYHGPDTQTKMLGGMFSDLTGSNQNHAVSESDYEVRMIFRCV